VGRYGFGGQDLLEKQPGLRESPHTRGDGYGLGAPRRFGLHHGATAESSGETRDDDPQIPQGDAQMADGAVMSAPVHRLGPSGGAGCRRIPQEACIVRQVHVV